MGIAAAVDPRRVWRNRKSSARLRLTLLYSGMFLVLGTALVFLIFLLSSSGTAVAVSASPGRPGGAPFAVRRVVLQQHSADVNRLLAGSWLMLVVTAAASTLIGWFLAGRVLRPLREMTVTARTISAGSLHQRVAVSGPPDEFRQLGDTIDELLARLERSFAAQRRFVANAAHELRTPLTVERTILQVALADPDASAQRLRVACEELLASGRDQERLLESLLTLATSERGLEDRVRLDLAGITGLVLATARPTIEQAGLELSSQLEHAEISGDYSLIERLVANLIDNAVAYNVDGGRIRVATAVEDRRALLTVSNTGPTVPPESVERLFEPFRRLQADRISSTEGHHGLGLSIVRAVAVAHGGQASAAPGPDGGLTVTIRLPAAPPEPNG
jgi:signal transduction histidine kinase